MTSVTQSLRKRFLYLFVIPRAARTRSLPGCHEPRAPIAKPYTEQVLPCASKWLAAYIVTPDCRLIQVQHY